MYQGSTDAWLKFLAAWMDRRGMPKREADAIDEDLRQQALVKGFPRSFVDFYVAMQALDWPPLLQVEVAEDENEDEDESPVLEFSALDALQVGELGEVPEEFLDEHYRIYDETQEENAPHLPTELIEEKMIRLADFADEVFDGRVFINPYVRFDDGEWEAMFVDQASPYEVRFPSFADLVVWFYLRDVGMDESVLYQDHRNDSTGLSHALFED